MPAKTDKQLVRYAKLLREMRDNGWSIDVLAEVTLGGTASQNSMSDKERGFVGDMYRERLPASLIAAREARS